MTPQDFLSHVLPSDGAYCLAAMRSGMTGFIHRTFTDLDLLVAEAQKLSGTGHDIYFCVSSLDTKVLSITGSKGIRNRANCLSTKSLVLDVDVRSGKEGFYENDRDALVDIAALSKELQLGPPTIVQTGGGFHVYWTADTAQPSNQFVAKSSYFKKLVHGKYPKLVADATRVADMAGLLRIPGFVNLKYGKPVRVIRAPVSSQGFDPQLIATWLDAGTGIIAAASPSQNVVIFAKSPPVDLTKVIQNCGQLHAMALNNGASSDEPLWYAMLGLVKHGINASVWAHSLSSGHSGYNQQSTDNKLQQAIKTGAGPTTCKHFEGLNSAVCVSCPFYKKITSPIQLASGMQPPVPVTQPGNIPAFTPPHPYRRRQQGGIEVIPAKIDGEDDAEVMADLIYDYDLYPVKKLRDETTGEWLVRYRYYQPVDGWREEIAALADFADKKTAHKTLMRGGVVPTFGQGAKAYNVGRYMIESIRHLEKIQGSSQMYGQLGWRPDDTSFLVGPRMYSPGVTTEVETTGAVKQLVERFKIVGSLQKWSEIFDTYNKPGLESYAFGALLAFASPLYKFTGHSGIIYNIVGEKGSGKSTVLKIISSVWMKPEEQILKEGDTMNSAEVILGGMHNLPVTYDEITNIDDKKLSDLCYNITQGRGRNRLNSNASLKNNTSTWALILCASSNASLIDKLGQHKSNASAEAIRVFEVRIDSNNVLDKASADKAFRRLDKNYGVAGDIYARYLVDNKDAVIDQLEEATEAIDSDLGIKSPERFWSALLACVVVGGNIARNLGLHGYDMDAIYAWAARHIESMRSNVEAKTADATSVLGNFMASKVRGTVVVIKGKVCDTLMPHLREPTQMRVEIDAGLALAFIEYKCLVDYCKANSISISWWETKMKEMKILVETSKNKRLTAGMNDMPAINVRCWVLNLSGQGFRDDLQSIIDTQRNIDATPPAQ